MKIYKRRLGQAAAALVMGISLALAAGCGAVDSVNQSLDYANEATGFVTDVSSAGTELQRLAEQAVSDPQALADLKNQLQALRDETQQFVQAEAPAYAQSIHEELSGYAQSLSDAADSFLQQMEKQGFTIEAWQQTEIAQLIQQITDLKDQINQLGG
jgi:DNA repair ATPase RecN